MHSAFVHSVTSRPVQRWQRAMSKCPFKVRRPIFIGSSQHNQKLIGADAVKEQSLFALLTSLAAHTDYRIWRSYHLKCSYLERNFRIESCHFEQVHFAASGRQIDGDGGLT